MLVPSIFSKFSEIVSGFSEKKDADIFSRLSFLSWGDQVHGTKAKEVTTSGFQGEADAFWTIEKNIFCSVRVADCIPILFYIDAVVPLVGCIHSGWRGTTNQICSQTFSLLEKKGFLEDRSNIYCWIGPSICGTCYEFGPEVFDFFSADFVIHRQGKLYLDLKRVLISQLLLFGISPDHIEVSSLCTYTSPAFHSRRRDMTDQRMLAYIGMKI